MGKGFRDFLSEFTDPITQLIAGDQDFKIPVISPVIGRLGHREIVVGLGSPGKEIEGDRRIDKPPCVSKIKT
jgi:hypothetical protein